MRLRLTFKLGPETIAQFVGRELSKDLVSMADIEKVIETEQYLERITGLRVHIEEVPEEK